MQPFGEATKERRRQDWLLVARLAPFQLCPLKLGRIRPQAQSSKSCCKVYKKSLEHLSFYRHSHSANPDSISKTPNPLDSNFPYSHKTPYHLKNTHLAFTAFSLGGLSLLAHAFPSNAGSSNVAAPLPKRYNSEWCGVHVVQYQKNEGPGSDTSVYRFDIDVKDAYQNGIGEVSTVPSPATVDSSNSQLPSPLTVTGGNVDSDPVQFTYAGQSWAFDGSTCSEGGYQNGNRNMDCGFTC